MRLFARLLLLVLLLLAVIPTAYAELDRNLYRNLYRSLDRSPARALNPVTPLRVVEVGGNLMVGTDSQGGADRQAFRWPIVMGTDAYRVAFAMPGWYLGSSSITNAPNNYGIVSMSLEAPNGTVAPVYFAGLRTTTVTAGSVIAYSDFLLPSTFGYSKFSRGQTWWVKGILSVTAGQSNVYPNLYTGDVAGSQADWYASGATTPSSTDSAGAFTYSGTPPSGRISGFKPVLIGNPLVDGPSFAGVGDSIMRDQNDGTASPVGRGFFSRALYNGGTNPYPGLKIAQSGVRSLYYNGSTKLPAWYALVRYAVFESGTNDFRSGDALASVKSREQTNWIEARAAGITKIIRTPLMADTTSTDSWATYANQTPFNAKWTSGGEVQQFNTWMVGQIGTTIDAVPDFTALRGTSTNSHLWIVTGGANYATQDGTHPSNTLHGFAGNALRTSMDALN